MPGEIYYIVSPHYYAHSDWHYASQLDTYIEDEEFHLSTRDLDYIFDHISQYHLLATKPKYRFNPIDGHVSYPIIYAVTVIDEHQINKPANTTDKNNMIILNATFGDNLLAYYPTSYETFFENNKGEQTVNGIKALLRDYATHSGWFSMHPLRHHADLAKKIANALPHDPLEAYQYLINQRNTFHQLNNINHHGSFAKRLDFAIAQLKENCNLTETARAHLKFEQ